MLVQCLTCTPALPYMCRSPAKDPLHPVNEKKGRGTGMGTLMPTCGPHTSGTVARHANHAAQQVLQALNYQLAAVCGTHHAYFHFMLVLAGGRTTAKAHSRTTDMVKQQAAQRAFLRLVAFERA